MSILYADDDKDDRDLFAEVFSELAPRVVLVSTGDGADVISTLESFAELPQLIVLDMNMPRMTGLECLIEIRKQPRYAKIPTVIFSTSGSPGTVRAALENGADEYYLKADSYEALETFIANLIVRYNLTGE
jgi:CheY-like chemotaxis protein